MGKLLRLWFGLRMPVDRRTYLVHGAGLMAFKYCADTLALRLVARMKARRASAPSTVRISSWVICAIRWATS